MRERIRSALMLLPPPDRELLALRHLEQMALAEIATVLGITEGAAKVRHVRALQRFQKILGAALGEEAP
jgi:RNA polymerase sigma-70 factor (ECF subfamily)